MKIATEEKVEVKKEYADSVDKDGTWLKKRGKYHFGYKKHHVTDNKGLVLGVLTTTASKNEIANLEEVFRYCKYRFTKGHSSKD